MYHSVSLHKGLYFQRYRVQCTNQLIWVSLLGFFKANLWALYHLHLSSIHNNSSNIIDMDYICLPDRERCASCPIPKIKRTWMSTPLISSVYILSCRMIFNDITKSVWVKIVIPVIGAILRKPHHMRSTVESVFLLDWLFACLICHPLYG